MKRRTAKPSQLVIKQAINLIFDHKKRQNETTTQQKPLIVRYIGRMRTNWFDYLGD